MTPSPPAVEITGPAVVLASRYDVTSLATDAVAAATQAAADLLSARTSEPAMAVAVDRVAACAAFAGERLFRPDGWQLPPVWDPIAGDYPAANGWIRLHTNYAHHRAAVLQTLALPAEVDRDAVAAAVAGRDAQQLEAAVVAAGGPAAVLHSTAAWLSSSPGRAAQQERLRVDPAPPAAIDLPAAGAPLTGVRVLDLTRVIAGPVCTRFLAAYGADVLRIDPPGFAEVPALVPEVTAGKRCAALDLRSDQGRQQFLSLVRQAHVVVSGLRDGALPGLGLGPAQLRAINPSVIDARMNAYGWDGPWRSRRGFDSLVQMSCGLAHLDQESAPAPLPVQALDHATGYLLAAAVCRALARQVRTGVPCEIRTSLVATANILLALPRPTAPAAGTAPPAGTADPHWPAEVFETVPTFWGPARRVRVPGSIAGNEPAWAVHAGPLGRHEPSFS
jgi:hypothetical protein